MERAAAEGRPGAGGRIGASATWPLSWNALIVRASGASKVANGTLRSVSAATRRTATRTVTRPRREALKGVFGPRSDWAAEATTWIPAPAQRTAIPAMWMVGAPERKSRQASTATGDSADRTLGHVDIGMRDRSHVDAVEWAASARPAAAANNAMAAKDAADALPKKALKITDGALTHPMSSEKSATAAVAMWILPVLAAWAGSAVSASDERMTPMAAAPRPSRTPVE